MNLHAPCPECGNPIPAHLPAAICPRCALLGSPAPAGSTPTGGGPGDATDPSRPFAPGRTIGNYELIEEIARGGMGIVFKARQRSLGRLVALKVMREIGPGETRATSEQRFHAEALAAGRLQHPNIVSIHEVGLDHGQPFIVMDLVDGPTLARHAANRPLDATLAARWARDIARAVQAAHDQHVLHRDLKPSNVLIDPSGHPKLTDFGLARRLDTDSSLTLSHQLIGSPGYMPPEQAGTERASADHRSDVYGIGAILYHLLTGRPPFQGASIADTVHQVIHNDPAPPRLVNPDAHPDLETICLKCLDKDPEERYAAATDVAEELDRVLRDEPILARPTGPVERVRRWARRRPGTAALLAGLHLALALGTAGIAWQWRRAESHARAESRLHAVAEASNQRLRLQQINDRLNGRETTEGLASLAQFLRSNPSNTTLAIRALSVLSQRTFPLPSHTPWLHQIPVETAALDPASPWLALGTRDGRVEVWDRQHPGTPLFHHRFTNGLVHVAFTTNHSQLLAVPAGSMPRLWNLPSGEEAASYDHGTQRVRLALVIPNGQTLVTIATDHLVRVWDIPTGRRRAAFPTLARVNELSASADGSTFAIATDDAALVAQLPTGRVVARLSHRGRVLTAALSPDGRRIMTGGDGTVARLWDVARQKVIAECPHDLDVVESAAFSPTGECVVTGGRDRTARRWDPDTGASLGPPLVHDGTVGGLEFSADGRRLLTQCGNASIRVWDTGTGETVCEPIRHAGSPATARIDAQGEFILVAGPDVATQLWDIRPAAILPLRLPHHADVPGIRFSPDGTRLVTASYDGTARLWDPRTGSPASAPLTHGTWVNGALFAPAGDRLLTTAINGTFALWDPLHGEPIVPLTRTTTRIDAAAFSPDGSHFGLTFRNGTFQIRDSASGTPTSPPQRHGGSWLRSFRFSPDGSRVITASDDGTARVWHTATLAPTGLVLRHNDVVHAAEFSPDGQWIATSSDDLTTRIWDAATGQPLSPPLRHAGRVRTLALSPDGRQLLTGTDGGAGHLWDPSTGHPTGERLHHGLDIRQARFALDGSRIVTAAADNGSRVWDARSGWPISEVLGRGRREYSADLSPDGRWLATASFDGLGRIYELPAPRPDDGPSPPWLPDLIEAMVGLRRHDNGLDEPVPPTALLELSQRLQNRPPSSGAASTWDRWAAWLLAARGNRAISPHGTMSLSNYIHGLFSESSPRSLELARTLDPANPRVLARWVRLAARHLTNSSPSHARRILADSRRAVDSAPDNADAWLGRAEVLARTHPDDTNSIAAALARAVRLSPASTDDQLDLSRIATLARDFETALAAADAAVQTAATDSSRRTATAPATTWQRPGGLLRRALEHRRQLFVDAGRTAEAQVDFLRLHIPPRDPSTPAACVDLSPFYNAALDADWHTPPGSPTGWNLSNLPRGHHLLRGTPFDLRGVIQLHCRELTGSFPDWPRTVSGIPIDRPARALHFLHASIWTEPLRAGTVIGSYTVHYIDGTTARIPIVHLEDSAAWQAPPTNSPTLPRATPAWRGPMPNRRTAQLFLRTWSNPHPDLPIRSLDFSVANNPGAPFLVAITADP